VYDALTRNEEVSIANTRSVSEPAQTVAPSGERSTLETPGTAICAVRDCVADENTSTRFIARFATKICWCAESETICRWWNSPAGLSKAAIESVRTNALRETAGKDWACTVSVHAAASESEPLVPCAKICAAPPTADIRGACSTLVGGTELRCLI
jgi:hypothetical protein